MSNYQFSDAYSSVLTAAANAVGGALQPIVQVSSISGQLPVTQSGTWVTSVVGSVNISSIAGAFIPYAQPGSFTNGVSSVVTGTTAASVLSAPGANLRNYITQIKVTNASATGAVVNIKDSGANVIDTGYAAASGGGWSSTFPTPIKQLTTNASVDVVSLSQASILAQISGYIAA